MIATLLFMAQAAMTRVPPLKVALPATTWACDFHGADGGTFSLSGKFDEVPVGTDRYKWLPTTVQGNRPDQLNGTTVYQGIDSFDDVRTYEIKVNGGDSTSYTILLSLLKSNLLGIATISHFVPDTKFWGGKLLTFAAGNCRATFHPVGNVGATQ